MGTRFCTTAITSCLFFTSLSLYSADLPEPTGPYAVGTRVEHWVDANRLEPMGKDALAHRELVIQFWYPAEKGRDRDNNATRASYIPEYSAFAPYLAQVRQSHDLDLKRLARMRTHAVLGAQLAAAPERFPFLIFSPGNFNPRWLYTAQMEELASHGYVVAALDHPYNTAIVAFPDGRVVLAPRESKAGSYAQRVEMRAADLRFVLNEFAKFAPASSGSWLASRIDLQAGGIFGHSLGGTAAVATCSDDARCKACINLDGGSGEIAENIQRGLQQPFLLLTKAVAVAAATEAQLKSWGMSRNEYSQLMAASEVQRKKVAGQVKSVALVAAIQGVQHDHFSDVPLLEKRKGVVAPERATEIVNAYTVAFFDQYLRNSPSALLNGTSSKYAEVVLEKYSAVKPGMK